MQTCRRVKYGPVKYESVFRGGFGFLMGEKLLKKLRLMKLQREHMCASGLVELLESSRTRTGEMFSMGLFYYDRGIRCDADKVNLLSREN